MSEYQIAVVVGSLRRDSLNRKLASAMARLAPSDFSFRQLEIGDLPLYNQDHDAQPTESVQRLKAEIAAAQGLLFVTPEFDHAGPLRCLGKTACRLITTQLARGVRGFSMCRRCAEYGMMHGAEGRHHCPTPKHPLVADVTVVNRQILQTLLRKDGHSVVLAEDGKQAVAQFEKEQPDLIIMDLMMPEMDGKEATLLIKQRSGTRFVPVIFLTAVTDEKGLTECLASGGDDVLTKPYSLPLLRAKLSAWSRVQELHARVTEQKQELESYRDRSFCEIEVANEIRAKILATPCMERMGIDYHVAPAAILGGDLVLAGTTLAIVATIAERIGSRLHLTSPRPGATSGLTAEMMLPCASDCEVEKRDNRPSRHSVRSRES